MQLDSLTFKVLFQFGWNELQIWSLETFLDLIYGVSRGLNKQINNTSNYFVVHIAIK